MTRQILVRNSISGIASHRHSSRDAAHTGHGFLILRARVKFISVPNELSGVNFILSGMRALNRTSAVAVEQGRVRIESTKSAMIEHGRINKVGGRLHALNQGKESSHA